jgi:hypothetical protein
MLGEDREATVDGVHFTDLGMYRQAVVFLKCLEPILKKQKSNKILEHVKKQSVAKK